MLVRAAHKYSHAVETVFATFCQPEFYRAKFEAVGARKVRVLHHERSDGQFRIRTEREMPLEVPALLRNVLGQWNRIVQSEAWEDVGGEYVNTLDLSSDGVPVRIRGSMLLSPRGKSCVNEVEMEIRCDIPLLGRKLASFVAERTERGLADEYEFIRDYLATAKAAGAPVRKAAKKSAKKKTVSRKRGADGDAPRR